MNQHTGNTYDEMDKKKRHLASAGRGDAGRGGPDILPDVRGLGEFQEPVQGCDFLHRCGE